MSEILVVKLGALGDLVQALGPFAAIRRHHARDRVTLLTTTPFVEFAKASGLFDDVRGDGRTNGWLDGFRLARRLGREDFARVYDLQTSGRSSLLFHFWPRPRPEWSGIARGASHPHANPRRDFMHTIERQAEQLAMAGIAEVPAADLDFARADPARFGLVGRYAILAPGGAAHRPAKRWAVENYAAAADFLKRRAIEPVVVGHGALEESLAARVGGRSLVGATSLTELAGLCRQASVALGNDTGPMHVAAAAGAPTLVLFGVDSDPALCAPRGARVKVIRRQPLDDLGPDEVLAALDPMIG